MNSKYPVNLTYEQRAHLTQMIHSGSCPARQQNRARILLLSDQSQEHALPDAEVARSVMVSVPTVANVRRRLAQEGLEWALSEKIRPGRPPKITGDVEAQLVVLACSDPPEGHAHWTLRLLTNELIASGTIDALSHVAVGNTLKKTRSSLGRSKPGVLASPRRGM